jgi:aminobenzoyl-glutamate transport protein
MAFRTALAFLVLYVGVILMLTVVPHAVLLSATGQLFPSPFSRALVPIVSFGVLLASAVYGWASGRFSSFADVIASLAYGIQQAAPLFILYVVAVQFYASLKFVF